MNTLRNRAKSPYAAVFLLWVFLFIYHLKFLMVGGDEEFFGAVITNSDLLTFSIKEYQTWSSRQILELFECIFGWLPKLVWRVVNPLVAALLAACMAKATGADKNREACFLLCGLIIIYPWETLADAGWISTTLVYLWPAAFGSLALLPLLNALRGEKTPKWLYIAAIPAMLYACNMEQSLIFILLSLICGVIYIIITKKYAPKYLISQVIIALLMLTYTLTCVGNTMRTEVDASNYFQNFKMLSPLSKFEMGLSFTLSQVIYKRSYVFLFFTLILMLAVFCRHKSVFYRIMGAVPFAVTAVLGTYQKITLSIFPALSFFTDSYTGQGMINLSNCSILTAYIPMLLLYGVFALCVVDLYLIFGHTPKALATILVFGIGLGTRVAMGFTPSIGISGGRTGLFFALACIGVAVAAYITIPKRAKIKYAFLPFFAAYLLLQMYSTFEM